MTLQEICDYNFEEWPEVNNPCPECCKIHRLQGYEIKLINLILIIKLEIFSNNEGNNCKIMELKINEVPKAVVTIRNRKFRVVSAIFHNGNSILSGYYYTMLWQDKN